MVEQRRDRVRRTSPEVEKAAKRLRRQMTPAEALLWSRLRRDQLNGRHFRRQHPVGRFVLDFYCADEKLVIEVDGDIHDLQEERDRERTAVLASAGYRVIRFRNEEVLQRLDYVISQICLKFRHNSSPPPALGEGLGEGADPPPLGTTLDTR